MNEQEHVSLVLECSTHDAMCIQMTQMSYATQLM
jgi:hypothetical protein